MSSPEERSFNCSHSQLRPEPEEKTQNEVLGARVSLYMAAAAASHLVKIEPSNEDWWDQSLLSVRRLEGVEKAEAILLRAQKINPKVAMIAFNLACLRFDA
jgi:hypothetical protein